MKSGFTLVEILVVVAITAIFSAYAISYATTSRRQTALSITRAQIGQMILKARALTLSTKLRTSLDRPCGYGVRVDYPGRKLSLFSYSEDCENLGNALLDRGDVFSGVPRWEDVMGGTIMLDSEVQFTASPPDLVRKLDTVFFAAPDPTMLVWINRETQANTGNQIKAGKIYLETEDGVAKNEITVISAAGAGEVRF